VGVLPGSDRWRQVLVRPGEHPVRELGLTLGGGATAVGTADHSGGEAAEGNGAAGSAVLGRAAGNLLQEVTAAAQRRLLLVVDQFEEVFTSCRDEGERAAFLGALVEAVQADDGQLTVVVAVRADYYGHCVADPALAGLLAANHLLVGPMRPEEVRRAIELPARRAGLRLEPGLADAMIDEIGEEPGGLPLLSCALLESWQHRRGRTLTLAAYRQAGGVRGAVARLAERAWQQLDLEQQAVARRVLLRLVGPGEGEAVVRRRVPLDEVALTHDERSRAVLETLTDQRLLTKSQESVELAHEALLREWPRLRGWLEEDVQGRALHHHLAGAAREWEQAGRDPGELYRGARLTGALDWAREHRDDLNRLERQFLDESRAAGEREVADARRRAEREARTSRRLRGLLAGLAVVLVLALVAGGLALTLRGRAERQALETRGDLLAALLRSPAATAILRGDLDGIGALGLSRDGALLAVGDKDGTVAIYYLRTRRLLQEQDQAQEQVNSLEFSPDGTLLAISTNGEGDPVRLWDIRGARVRQDLKRADNDHVATGVAFSTDGRTLVTLSGDKDADIGIGKEFLTPLGRRQRPATQRPGPHLLPRHRRPARLPGRQALGGGARRRDARVRGGPLRAPAPLPPPAATATGRRRRLEPSDGRTLALWPNNGPIQFLDLDSGRHRQASGRQVENAGGDYSMRFSPNGKTLATGGDDGTVRVWDVASGQLRETFRGHEARVSGLRFNLDGRTLYSAGSKSVIAWDLEGASRLGRPFSFFPGASPAVAISSDGSLVATVDVKDAEQVALRAVASPEKVKRSLAPQVGPISAVAFSPDGKLLAVGGDDASAPVLLNVDSGRVVGRMSGGRHPGGVSTMQFDPKGGRLVTGGKGGPHDHKDIVWTPPPASRSRPSHSPAPRTGWRGARTGPRWPLTAGTGRSSSGAPPAGRRS
jgi:WD40 repeat protein